MADAYALPVVAARLHWAFFQVAELLEAHVAQPPTPDALFYESKLWGLLTCLGRCECLLEAAQEEGP